MSGQEASFLAGGQFPIPVPQPGGGGSSITIEYKDYGVKLKFTPVVLGNGTIRLKVQPEVSELDYSNAVQFNGYVAPGLTTRTVVTTVEMGEGQTFAIAGLLNNSVNAASNVTPILGDLPIIGTLFRSMSYQRNETELVVLVTPRLVNPMNPGEVPTLPGEHWRFPTEAELFWNQDLGGEMYVPPGPATRPTVDAPMFHGSYGFVPAGETASTSADGE
jgi:pilus assembly protein CpaC